MSENKFEKVVVLGTGGTIAGVASSAEDLVGYTAGQIDVRRLLDAMAVFGELPLPWVAEQVAQVDSKDMEFALWQQLVRRVEHWLLQPDVRGLVITHGTDTLEETAYFLHRVLPIVLPPGLLRQKPVVLTCAMRPATALQPDGPQNLRDALTLAMSADAAGVVVVCAGKIHDALHVQKVHTQRLDAFSSGDAGAIGHLLPCGQIECLKWPYVPAGTEELAIKNVILHGPTEHWPVVEIVVSHAACHGQVVDALLAQRATAQSALLRGIVVAGTGNATLHQALLTALLRAQAAGVRVQRSTRCAFGPVLSAPGAALPDAGGLSPVKARIALMLALMAQND